MDFQAFAAATAVYCELAVTARLMGEGEGDGNLPERSANLGNCGRPKPPLSHLPYRRR